MIGVRGWVILLGLFWLTGCSKPEPVALQVTDIEVFAPLPGSGRAVAYLTLHSNVDEPLAIKVARSPQFASVEFHLSSVNDGIARMQEVPQMIVPAQSSLQLAPGGLHLMLIDPLADLVAGDAVTLTLLSSAGHQVSIEAVLQSRMVGGE